MKGKSCSPETIPASLRHRVFVLSLPLLLSLVLFCFQVSTQAQGTVNFHNLPPVPDAPAFNIDGTTRLNGPRYQALLFAGPDASSLAPVGSSVSFLSGDGAGYFAGGARVIPTVAPGQTAFVAVGWWDTVFGDTWETATVKCLSPTFTVVTGGAGEPPSLPAILTGLSLNCIPEPSTFLLGLFGVAPWLWKRWRKRQGRLSQPAAIL